MKVIPKKEKPSRRMAKQCMEDYKTTTEWTPS